MKEKKFSTIIFACLAILCIGFVGITGAWFFNRNSNEISITLANGIQLEATGLKQNDATLTGTLQNSQTYQLVFTNNQGVAPGATITVENVTLKTKADVNSANSFLRFKIGYEYSTDNGTSWVSGTYLNCKLTNQIAVKQAAQSSAGFVQVGDWNYYFNHSTSTSYSNLAVLNGTAVSLFNGNQSLVIGDEIDPNAQIRITLTIDAIQATQNAAQAEWAGALA